MTKDQEPKNKGGFTVGELEGKVKKYGLEIALCVVFVLTAVFALVHGSSMLHWSILLCMIFAIVGILVPKSMDKITTHALRFIYKEKITSIVMGVIACLVAIFLPPIIFAIVGLVAGKAFSLDGHMKNPHSKEDDHDHHDHDHKNHHDHNHDHDSHTGTDHKH